MKEREGFLIQSPAYHLELDSQRRFDDAFSFLGTSTGHHHWGPAATVFMTEGYEYFTGKLYCTLLC